MNVNELIRRLESHRNGLDEVRVRTFKKDGTRSIEAVVWGPFGLVLSVGPREAS